MYTHCQGSNDPDNSKILIISHLLQETAFYSTMPVKLDHLLCHLISLALKGTIKYFMSTAFFTLKVF